MLFDLTTLGWTVEVWERMSNFIPHTTDHVITYPFWCYGPMNGFYENILNNID